MLHPILLVLICLSSILCLPRFLNVEKKTVDSSFCTRNQILFQLKVWKIYTWRKVVINIQLLLVVIMFNFFIHSYILYLFLTYMAFQPTHHCCNNLIFPECSTFLVSLHFHSWSLSEITILVLEISSLDLEIESHIYTYKQKHFRSGEIVFKTCLNVCKLSKIGSKN